jgi:HK97 family phage major capsid protein
MTNQIEAKVEPLVGMKGADIRRYSLGRVLRSLINQTGLDGLEGEMDTELKNHARGAFRFEGIGVPADIFQPRRRDLNVNTFNSAGAFVQTSIDDSVIELLRNVTVCERLGVQRIDGLTGNVAFPRQTGAATAFSLPEQGALAQSTQAVDQVIVSPKRISAGTNYSKQLLLQSTPSLETFLREDLEKQINIQLDFQCIQGQGAASQINGLLNTTGVGSLTLGGATTWEDIVNFQGILAAANADTQPGGRIGWIVSPQTRAKWQSIAKTGIGVATTVPIFLWDEKNIIHDGTNDAYINGFRAAATNQVLNNLVFYGDFNDSILCTWGAGLDVTVDIFTLASQASVRIITNTWADLAVRHAASYVISSDGGNQ